MTTSDRDRIALWSENPNATVEYRHAYGGWCAVLYCRPGCACGKETVIHGFPDYATAEDFFRKTIAAMIRDGVAAGPANIVEVAL